MKGEFEIIARIQECLDSYSSRVRVGIGDDAAVINPSAESSVLTTDMLVEGVHFDLKYACAADVGAKAMAINLSDIAAMGAHPRTALISLGVPEGFTQEFLLDLYRGLGGVASEFGVDVVGGNLTRTPCWIINVTLLGSMAEAPVLRSGARAGELLFVSGFLGRAAAGLSLLQGGESGESFSELIAAQLRPVPKVVLGRKLVGLASSMVDVSDGLSSECHHLMESSGVGFQLQFEALEPWVEGLKPAAERLGKDSTDWVLHGGEDYELLFTVSSSLGDGVRALARELCVPLTEIGQVTGDGKLTLQRGEKISQIEAGGWNPL